MKIREMRINAGMSQKEAAKKLGIAQNTLSQFETGTNKVRAEWMPKLAQLYGCTIEELYGIAPQNKTAPAGGGR